MISRKPWRNPITEADMSLMAMEAKRIDATKRRTKIVNRIMTALWLAAAVLIVIAALLLPVAIWEAAK